MIVQFSCNRFIQGVDAIFQKWILKSENYLLPYKISCVVYELFGFCQEKESIMALKGLTG
jgi:hypothetical protein